jgi:GNAT superfamily N-acetyltransferase
MPDPIPVAILARLAVRRDRQGRGLGRALFRDAVFRVLNAAGAIGIRGLLVHAVSDEARAFYVGLGLVESPVDPLTLMASLRDLRDALD